MSFATKNMKKIWGYTSKFINWPKGTHEQKVWKSLIYLQRWSRGHKVRGLGQGHTKKSMAKAMVSPSEDRPSRSQGQAPKTQTQVFSKKKRSSKFFSDDLKEIKVFKFLFSGDIQQKRSRKNFFQPIYKILTIQKIVLSSSRGQGNFRGLEAWRLRT